MKKPDELALWKLFRETVNEDGLVNTHACIEALGMKLKRGYYLIDKWSDAELIDYGVGERWVWFREKGLNTPNLSVYP